jgi:hypothetical protein
VCLRERRYLQPRLATHFLYDQIKIDVSKGKTLADIGCCMGTDLRRLYVDAKQLNPGLALGNPGSVGLGLEMESEFLRLGYELFDDAQVAQSHFVHFDMLERMRDSSQLPVSFQIPSIAHAFDYVYEGSVIHLFLEADIKLFCERVTALLKPNGIFLGRHGAHPSTPGLVDRDAGARGQSKDDAAAAAAAKDEMAAATASATAAVEETAAAAVGAGVDIRPRAAGASRIGSQRYLHTGDSFRALLESIGFVEVDVRPAEAGVDRVPGNWPFIMFSAVWPGPKGSPVAL